MKENRTVTKKETGNGTAKRGRNMRIFGVALAVFCLIGFFMTKDNNSAEIGQSDAPIEASAYSGSAEKLISQSGGPESGIEFYRKYDRNPAAFHIVNESAADVCIRCADGLFNRSVLSFYLRANDELTISVPVGYFELHIAAGEKWEGAEALFGSRTLFFKDPSEHGQEFGRKKTCEFTIEEGLKNLIPISEDYY